MAQCKRMDDTGDQCANDAVDGSEYCADHNAAPPPEEEDEPQPPPAVNPEPEVPERRIMTAHLGSQAPAANNEPAQEERENGGSMKTKNRILMVLAGLAMLIVGGLMLSKCSKCGSGDKPAPTKSATGSVPSDCAAAEKAAKEAAADLAAAKKAAEKCGKSKGGGGRTGMKPPPPPMQPPFAVKPLTPAKPKVRYIITHPADGNGGVGVTTVNLD